MGVVPAPSYTPIYTLIIHLSIDMAFEVGDDVYVMMRNVMDHDNPQHVAHMPVTVVKTTITTKTMGRNSQVIGYTVRWWERGIMCSSPTTTPIDPVDCYATEEEAMAKLSSYLYDLVRECKRLRHAWNMKP